MQQQQQQQSQHQRHHQQRNSINHSHNEDLMSNSPQSDDHHIGHLKLELSDDDPVLFFSPQYTADQPSSSVADLFDEPLPQF